jgi:hypothetical protein
MNNQSSSLLAFGSHWQNKINLTLYLTWLCKLGSPFDKCNPMIKDDKVCQESPESLKIIVEFLFGGFDAKIMPRFTFDFYYVLYGVVLLVICFQLQSDLIDPHI